MELLLKIVQIHILIVIVTLMTNRVLIVKVYVMVMQFIFQSVMFVSQEILLKKI